MSKGFVLSFKPEGDEDRFRTVYEALPSQCFQEGAQWFGWCETDFRLPRPLDDEAFDPCWDAVRVFSPIAELRAQRRGKQRLVLLLTEDKALADSLTRNFETTKRRFIAQPGCRILVGLKPDKPVGHNPNALIEVMFPRELDYGISAEQGERLVADVRCYFDDENRLHFVRYCLVQPERIGAREVKPL
jgi:hypothetical protein